MKQFNVPLFGDLVTICHDKAEWDDRRMALNPDAEPWGPCAGAVSTVTQPNGQTEYLVGVFDGDPSTLIHELTHASLFIVQRHGIEPAGDNGEVLCRVMEALWQGATADE